LVAIVGAGHDGGSYVLNVPLPEALACAISAYRQWGARVLGDFDAETGRRVYPPAFTAGIGGFNKAYDVALEGVRDGSGGR